MENSLVTSAWRREAVAEIYRRPLVALIQGAAAIHRLYHEPGEVQTLSLIHISEPTRH